jgi:acetoin utilization deacetylase AcuC-like enzyme
MTTAYGYDPLFLTHDLAGHPENSERLRQIMQALDESGLLSRMSPIAARPATAEALRGVHAEAHVSRVQRVATLGGGFLDPDTYVGPTSYDAGVLAAGACTELVRAVVRGDARNGIALVRPPGHHATRERGMGFCLFNNIAVAAQTALREMGLSRVLIVDWDVHHGNGTEDIFYHSPDVLFFSTHQSPHYPGSGHWREVGEGPGAGYTANVPLPAGVGDAGFARIYREILIPLAERFRPELIMVSAGYDAHWKDPLAGLHLSLAGYWRIAQVVLDLAERLCQGRLVVVLEGGYSLPVLTHAVADTCRALLRDPAPGPDPFGPSTWPERPVDAVLRSVRQAHGL